MVSSSCSTSVIHHAALVGKCLVFHEWSIVNRLAIFTVSQNNSVTVVTVRFYLNETYVDILWFTWNSLQQPEMSLFTKNSDFPNENVDI